MESLEVGKRVIVFTKGSHKENNFNIGKIVHKEQDLKTCRMRYHIKIEKDGFDVSFCLYEDEMIPICDVNKEDLKKYPPKLEDIVNLFDEYKGYYDTICSICDDISRENVKNEKQISEMQSNIDCLQAKSSDIQAQNEKLRARWKNLGFRCHDSARELFENDLCDCLHIVTADELTQKVDLPTEPIKVADMLISANVEYETSSLARTLGAGEKSVCNVYDISDLRQIAEHLLVYCNNTEEK